MPNTPKGLTYPSSSSPVAVPADIQELATDVDGLIVPNTGGTYTGSVSFTQSPSVPTPTSSLHAVNKTYADAITDRFNKVGNLLTANQASGGDALGNTTGYTPWQATIARSTAWAAQGTGSILVTATTDHPVVDLCAGGTGGIPVTPGETYTATVDTKAGTAVGRSGELYINFWDSGGTWLSNTYSGWIQSTTPRTVVHTAVAPAGAAYMSPALAGYTAVATETFYFDKVGLWKGTGGQWAMPGTPIIGLTDGLAGIGNLLTANQASGTDTLGDTTGFSSASGATLARHTGWSKEGTGALLVTAAGSGLHDVFIERTDIVAGQTYTLLASVNRGTGSRTMRIQVEWYTAAYAYISQSVGATLYPSFTTDAALTVVAPATAAKARLKAITLDTGSAGDNFWIDAISWHVGSGGLWAMPGAPIVGMSEVASNGAVHLSGTGTPEGVVVAAPGSTWLQTDATTDVKGWIRWVKATGTGNTGWVAGAEADTGWRLVSADIINGWAANSDVFLRRQGGTVRFVARHNGLSAAGKSSSVFYNPPAGFTLSADRFGNYGNVGFADSTTTNGVAAVRRSTSSGMEIAGADAAWTAVNLNLNWLTDDAWPSSLPGSAA